MGRFKAGDKTIALSNPPNKKSQPRVKGQVYTVLNVQYCSYCGIQMINITSIIPTGSAVRCKCTRSIAHDDRMWTLSECFVKPEDLQEELDLAVEKEDYETAVILRDLLTNTYSHA